MCQLIEWLYPLPFDEYDMPLCVLAYYLQHCI